MSTVKNENIHLNSENFGAIQRNKQFHSERKHTVRKHALGEIKNVIHNHGSVTPFKGTLAGPSKQLCKELIKKKSGLLESQYNYNQKLEQSQKVHPVAITKPFELESIGEPIPRTCNGRCFKSLGEIWSEMNVLEPEVLERIVNGDGEADIDYDKNYRNVSPIDFDDFSLASETPNPYEIEQQKKMLDSILAKDYENPGFPAPLDWIDDL